ncbi:hypothetical protein [Variovorax boronicumulans]
MAKFIYTKRFAVPGHHCMGRYEFEDMRAYAELATVLMTAEFEKSHANGFELIGGLCNTCAANKGKRQWEIQKRLNELSSRP